MQLNNGLFANKGVFKLERLKAGLIGIRATKLHWLAIPCEADCVPEKAVLARVLKNFNTADHR